MKSLKKNGVKQSINGVSSNKHKMKIITKIILIILIMTQNGYANIAYDCGLDYYFEATIKKFADFDAIFIGRFTEGSLIKSEFSSHGQKVKVLKVFKGEVKKIEIVNFDYFGIFWKRKGEKYLIFANYSKNGKLYTNECSGSSKIDRTVGLYTKRDSLHWQIRKTTRNNIKFLNRLSKLKNGYVKLYFNNGKIMSEGKWKNGFPVGVWKHYNKYDKNGRLESQGSYNSVGKKVGEWQNIYSVENRHKIVNDKYIWLKKGFEIEYELYSNGQLSLGNTKYELYDESKKLVVDKENKTCENIHNEYLFVDDIIDEN